VTSLLDPLLLPQRVVSRALEDLRALAEAATSLSAFTRELRPWMDTTAASAESLSADVEGIRDAVSPMSRDMDALRVEFGRADDEIGRLREELVPEIRAFRASADRVYAELQQFKDLIASLDEDVKAMGERLAAEVRSLAVTARALERDAEEISEVVEPLQAATERVGNVAARLPGGRRKPGSR
jgi:ABC-type transporter Mla subunit MlaD